MSVRFSLCIYVFLYGYLSRLLNLLSYIPKPVSLYIVIYLLVSPLRLFSKTSERVELCPKPSEAVHCSLYVHCVYSYAGPAETLYAVLR